MSRPPTLHSCVCFPPLLSSSTPLQGTLRRGDFIYNVAKGEKVKVPRLVRMHSDQMEDIEAAGAGEIVATFGVDCASGDSFTADTATQLTMSSMFVPEPVISYSIKPVDQKNLANFTKVS